MPKILIDSHLKEVDNMDFSQNYENLLKQMKFKREEGKVTHNNFKISPLLPFQTRHPERVKFDNGFKSILGEFTRLELNKSLIDDFDINQIIFDIINNPSVDAYGEEKFLEKLLKEYLFTENNELNILNPYLFSYIPLSDNKQAIGEKDIALFLRDIFCLDNYDLIKFFEKDKSPHPVINLILNNIPQLNDKETPVKYKSVLDNIVDLFNEDIEYAINYENFLINDISNIFAYYYFFYTSQLVLKLNDGVTTSIDDVEPLYYLLDWEIGANKNRKTLKGYGWDLLKYKSYNLAAWISVVDQLNILFGVDDYCLLGDIYEAFNQLSLHDQEEFLKYFKMWIKDYSDARGLEDIILPDNFVELVDILYKRLNDESGIDGEIRTSRYPLNLEEIARAFFVKGRGKHGLVLNITREMLLTLTTLCIKDKPIKLKQLYKEYEKRGLFFDKYSKYEIEDFLTKLNLIDKKSDSGDAKYVRPIL